MGGGLPPRALRETSKRPIGIAERPISENRADGRLRRPSRGNTITLTFKLTLREDALATYVISDVHGHLRAFERALEMAAPGSQDAIFVLGDMVDRGPDPLGVMTRARALPNACVLMGNHESMLLDTVLEGDDLDMMSWHLNGGYVTSSQLDALPRDAYVDIMDWLSESMLLDTVLEGDDLDMMSWHLNGGYVTSSQLDALPRDAYVDIMDWLSALPAFAVVETDDARPSAGPGDRRVNVLCHAGVDAARDAYVDIMDWLSALPAFAVVETDDARPSAGPGDRRVNVLCHAGVDAERLRDSLSRRGAGPDALGGYAQATPDDLLAAMGEQDLGDLLWIREGFWSRPTGLVGRGAGPDALGGYAQATPDDLLAAMGEQDLGDLLWIREGFWSRPTGLVGADGRGPVVVAGHTPSAILGRYARQMCGTGVDGDLRGVMVEVGPTADTGGVADRICIDCSAAKGHPYGRVGIMRLEDRRVWLADIEEGE